MASYHDQINRQLEAAETVTIKGVSLEVGAEHPLKMKGYIAVFSPTCVCVTEPCPCDDVDGTIVWLPESHIKSQEEAKEKTKTGEALTSYRIDSSAKLICETFEAKTASEFNSRMPSSTSMLPRFAGAKPGFPPGGNGRKTLFSHSIECSAHTLFYVIAGPDGKGGTLLEYIPIGSCDEPTSSSR